MKMFLGDDEVLEVANLKLKRLDLAAETSNLLLVLLIDDGAVMGGPVHCRSYNINFISNRHFGNPNPELFVIPIQLYP